MSAKAKRYKTKLRRLSNKFIERQGLPEGYSLRLIHAGTGRRVRDDVEITRRAMPSRDEIEDKDNVPKALKKLQATFITNLNATSRKMTLQLADADGEPVDGHKKIGTLRAERKIASQQARLQASIAATAEQFSDAILEIEEFQTDEVMIRGALRALTEHFSATAVRKAVHDEGV